MDDTLQKEPHILLLEGIHPQAEEYFRQQGYTNIVTQTQALQGEELKKALENTDILGIRSNTKVTKEILQTAKKLAAIGCFCAGTNQIDLEAARKYGIPVFNAPFSNTRSVAELVIGEAIMLLRGIPQKNKEMHEGIWKKSASESREVRGKNMGIVGYGKIGKQVGDLSEKFGMNIIYFDIEEQLSLGNAQTKNSLKELAQISDVLTLHIPETSDTKNMVDADILSAMKKGSCLINASRGSVVDINALEKSLSKGHISGAAIDVFPEEPKKNGNSFESPLQQFNNVLLTPHIGGSTQEAQENIADEVKQKLCECLKNGSTKSAVNFPEVSLSSKNTNGSRIGYVHKNTPGVLGKINSVLSGSKINISAQSLNTEGDTGYMVLDTDTPIPEKTLSQIEEIEESIRLRVLK